jgi:hypothetical protein
MNAHTLLQQLRSLADEAAAALENGGVETLILGAFTESATPIWIQIGIAAKTANTPPVNMNATAIPKRTAAGQAPSWYVENVGPTDKESWHVAFVCPRGHMGWMDNHKIAADGKVTPSVVCPVKDCGFHQYITLTGWTPLPAPAPAPAPQAKPPVVATAAPGPSQSQPTGRFSGVRTPAAPAPAKTVPAVQAAPKSAPQGKPAPAPAQKTGTVSIPASKIVTLNPARRRKPAGM